MSYCDSGLNGVTCNIHSTPERKKMAQTKEGAVIVAAKKAGLTVPEYLAKIANGLKKCTLCKEWKELSSFANDSSRWDGKTVSCSQCTKALWRIRSMNGNQPAKPRDGDKLQARHLVNLSVLSKFRPNPNDLYCSLCGHKGEDRRHEYHHICGYSKEHHYDVLPLCSKCHHMEN